MASRPGRAGEEIYGCGAAFIFSVHAYHRLDGAPFTLLRLSAALEVEARRGS